MSEKCDSCGKNEASEPHACPFREIINNDDGTMCNCCDSCCDDCYEST